jgi:hypothetical protein
LGPFSKYKILAKNRFFVCAPKELQRGVFKWIFPPTGKVGAYPSVGFGYVRA